MKQRPRSPPPLTLLSFRRKLRPKESKDMTHQTRVSSCPLGSDFHSVKIRDE